MATQQQQQQSVDGAGAADDGLSVSFTGELTVAFVLVVFVLFLFVLILYLRAKRYAGATATRASRSRLLVFAEEHQPNLLRRALDPAVLASLPITVFHLKDFDDGGLECAVCLSELEEGEKARLLPKCNHGFHLDCIDMWFHSNSTCPLCRSSVGPLPKLQNAGLSSNLVENSHLAGALENGQLPESSNLAGSSSSGGGSSSRRMEGMLVIDIPRRAMEAGFSSPSSPALLSSKFPAEYIKTPTSVRLRPLSRMLSRGGSRGVGSSCSPGGYDTEQGVGASSTLPVSKAS